MSGGNYFLQSSDGLQSLHHPSDLLGRMSYIVSSGTLSLTVTNELIDLLVWCRFNNKADIQ